MTITNRHSVKLPYYFYNLNAVMPDDRKRWEDEFSDNYPHVIQPSNDLNPFFQRARAERNIAYSKWLAAFYHKDPTTGERTPMLSGKMFKWQAIRVLSFKHSEKSRSDWWENYQEAQFRAFIQPETIYDQATGEHKQWYLLSPEDCYLVNRYELEKNGPSLPLREFTGRERYLSANRELRKARLIPVECCHHLRNEGREVRELL